MANRITTITTELTTDPLARGYSGMTTVQKTDSLNKTIDRPDSNSISAMFDYLINKNHRTNQDSDIQYTPIIGRLYHVAESAIGDDPFGQRKH